MKLPIGPLPAALIGGAVTLWDDTMYDRTPIIVGIAEAIFIAMVIYYSVGWFQRKPLDGN